MKFPYFPFFVKDFSSDSNVEAMALNEVGAYMLLLCKAWVEDQPGTLPNDDRMLARWSRLFDHWQEHKSYVMAPFSLGEDGRWHQKRMEQVYADLCSRNAQASEKARRAAEKRWKNAPSIQKPCSKHAQPMPQAMLEQCNSNSNSNSTHTEAILPTVQEVIEYGSMGAAIPKDYCEHYHERSCVLNRWISRGMLIDWRRDISGSSWWGKDRATWGKTKGAFANRRTNFDRNAGTTNEKHQGAYAGVGKRKV